MHFEQEYIFHLYNQGNNKQSIFYTDENYIYFLKKIKKHILPYADVLAWCLMPNHFHLMIYVRKTEIIVPDSELMTRSHRLTIRPRTLNNSIAIMLRSYTRAINKQENFSGSLFRKKTKAECINCPNGLTPSFIMESGIAKIPNIQPEKQYPQICFNYVHQNPVKSGLVKKDIDWEYSSAKDYAGLRDGKLINKQLAKKILLEY